MTYDPNDLVTGTFIKGNISMQKVGRMAVIMFGMLLPVAGFADEAKSTTVDSETLPVEPVSLEELVAESKYASRWQLSHSIETMNDANDTPTPIATFLFQDSSTFARVSRLRSLSLLTLAESGKTRLFFGVNEKGLVGLHYSALPHYEDNRSIEMARMPYLKKVEPDGQVN